MNVTLKRRRAECIEKVEAWNERTINALKVEQSIRAAKKFERQIESKPFPDKIKSKNDRSVKLRQMGDTCRVKAKNFITTVLYHPSDTQIQARKFVLWEVIINRQFTRHKIVIRDLLQKCYFLRIDYFWCLTYPRNRRTVQDGRKRQTVVDGRTKRPHLKVMICTFEATHTLALRSKHPWRGKKFRYSRKWIYFQLKNGSVNLFLLLLLNYTYQRTAYLRENKVRKIARKQVLGRFLS